MEGHIGIARCALATAATLALLFGICWAGAYLAVAPASHLFVALFTSATPTTTLALATGLGSALFFGALTGAVYAILYNAIGRWIQR